MLGRTWCDCYSAHYCSGEDPMMEDEKHRFMAMDDILLSPGNADYIVHIYNDHQI